MCFNVAYFVWYVLMKNHLTQSTDPTDGFFMQFINVKNCVPISAIPPFWPDYLFYRLRIYDFRRLNILRIYSISQIFFLFLYYSHRLEYLQRSYKLRVRTIKLSRFSYLKRVYKTLRGPMFISHKIVTVPRGKLSSIVFICSCCPLDINKNKYLLPIILSRSLCRVLGVHTCLFCS